MVVTVGRGPTRSDTEFLLGVARVHVLEAALAVKRLGPCACFPLFFPPAADRRPMSRLRRPLLPVTSSSFTAPEVHTRSWRTRQFLTGSEKT